jgi:hypothetical protein
VGYHGCNQRFALDLVANRVSLDTWKASEHSYDWLGAGIYFWEHAPGRAWQWAMEHHRSEPAVVATEISLGTCLDLGDTVFTDLLRESYNAMLELHERNGWALPKNEGSEQKLRRLDRMVIDTLTEAAEARGISYQTVRSPFEEGEAVYPGGMLREHRIFNLPSATRLVFRPAFTWPPPRRPNVTTRELVEQTRQALQEFRRLPPEEQVKMLVKAGTIDANGRVLLGREDEIPMIILGEASWHWNMARMMDGCLSAP